MGYGYSRGGFALNPNPNSTLLAPKPAPLLPALLSGRFKTRPNQVGVGWIAAGWVVIANPIDLVI